MKIIEAIRQKNNIVRAVIYARFSSDMQREESIEAQVRAIRDFAETNNIVLVGEYFDRAKSGTSSDRAEFQRLLKDAAKHEFDLVLVHKVDRFARSRYDAANARFHLKRHGVTVMAVAQLYDSESPEGIILEAMLEAYAEYYSLNLASEVEKGKRENALKGKHVGGIPPLGYDVDRDSRLLIINEHEAAAVRQIFKLALDGEGYNEIIQAMKKQGYKTKRGHDFGKNSLFSILKNEKYTGVYTYSKSAAKDADGKRNGHRYKDDEDIIRVEGVVPAIISKTDFEEVQRLMHKRSKRTGSYSAKETYLLSGKVVCGECGSTFAGNSRRARPDHPKYVSYCCTKRNHSIQCKNKEMRREPLEEHVLQCLSKLVFREDLIATVVKGYNEYMDSIHEDLHDEQKQAETAIQEVQKKIDNLVAVIAQSGSVALTDGLKQLETEKADLQGQLDVARYKSTKGYVRETDIFAAFRHAQRMLESKSLHNKKQLVQTFIETVSIFEDRVEIRFNLDFDPEMLQRSLEQKRLMREMFGSKYNKDTTSENVVSLVGGEGEENDKNTRKCASFPVSFSVSKHPIYLSVPVSFLAIFDPLKSRVRGLQKYPGNGKPLPGRKTAYES